MIHKSLPILMILLMMSTLVFAVGVVSRTSFNSMQDIQSTSVPTIAETDLGRVAWQANTFPNSGVEDWSNPHTPLELYTTRTTEGRVWTESTVVDEGIHSVGIQGRALDPSHYSNVRLTQSAWSYWNNPTNTTLDFEYYIDAIGNPIDADYFLARVQISNRYLYYYIGCEQTGVVNGTYGQFFIVSSTGEWNHFRANLTSDYIASFSLVPTQFQVIDWFVRSYTNTYTRVFMDDVNLINGTTVKIGGSVNNGNFEVGGSWFYQSTTDAADISQSSARHEGDWSMNMTALSNISYSYARANVSPEKLLTESNLGHLSFWWRINDWTWTSPTSNTRARVVVTVANATYDFSMYYYLCEGGSDHSSMPSSDSEMSFVVTGFNATGSWNFFDRNIWEDFHSRNASQYLWISEIEFQVQNYEHGSQLTVLIDDIKFISSILNDMSYEYQTDVGTPIQGWGPIPGSNEFTVTDFAFTGSKAANLTLASGQSYGETQTIGKVPADATTELILDFNVYIESFNQSSQDFAFLSLGFNDREFAYVIANSTSAFESSIGEGDGAFILLQDTIVKGEWINFQLDIVHDYESLFGSIGDNALRYIYLSAESSTGSRLTVFFDDVYIYNDVAPAVSNVHHSLTYAPGGGPVSALVTAHVVDATPVSVVVNYRINNGTWQEMAMSHVSEWGFEANITDLVGQLTVDYSVTATDAFSKTTTALNGTEYFRFSVNTGGGPPVFGDLLGPVLIAGVIVAIGIVFLVYIFVIKKR
jgi:hypothetical protein